MNAEYSNATDNKLTSSLLITYYYIFLLCLAFFDAFVILVEKQPGFGAVHLENHKNNIKNDRRNSGGTLRQKETKTDH